MPQWALPVAQPAFALGTLNHSFEVSACHEASVTSVQALLHLLLECGELGATVGILWHSLRAYQPLALGWFRARARPLRAWLCPALLACAFFPLVDLAAARSQVRTLVLSWQRGTKAESMMRLPTLPICMSGQPLLAEADAHWKSALAESPEP